MNELKDATGPEDYLNFTSKSQVRDIVTRPLFTTYEKGKYILFSVMRTLGT